MRLLMAALLSVAFAGSGAGCAKREAQANSTAASGFLDVLLQQDSSGFARPQGRWKASFPADHAAHPDYRSESWHFSGIVSSPEGRRFGFQLTFVRIALLPPHARMAQSEWAARDAYWAQFGFIDVEGNRSQGAERLSRAALGMSGATSSPTRVWVEDWSMELRERAGGGSTFALQATHGDVRLELSLTAAKPAISPQNGPREADLAAAGTFHGYLMTRLLVEGSIAVAQGSFGVEGTAWLDRAWGLVPLPVGAVVWDRLIMQLEDGRELMAVRFRRRDGRGEPTVSGVLVERDGSVTALADGALSMDAVAHWTSPRDGASFPVEWRLRAAQAGIDLRVTPLITDQERWLSLRSWAGAIRVSGTADGEAIRGFGYAEVPA